MTLKEAIEELRSYADSSWGGLNEAFQLAIDAMTKVNAIEGYEPIKWETVPIVREDPDGDWIAIEYHCPGCGRVVYRKEPFCPTCGNIMEV